MTQINQNTDNNRYIVQQGQVRVPQLKAQREISIPEYYQIPEERLSLKESLQENPATMMGYEFVKPLIEHPLPSIITWLGAGYLLDKYTNACSGEYEKCLYKKAANFGDRIEKSRIVQSSPVQSFLKGTGKIGNAGKYVINHSAILRAMRDTPTRPEWSIPLSEMLSQRQRIIHEFNTVASNLKLGEDGFATLNKLALSKNEKQILKQMPNLSEQQASSWIQLARLGKNKNEIEIIVSEADGGVNSTKKAILEAMGKDVEWIKKVKSDSFGKCIDEVEAVTAKIGNKVKVGMGDFRPMGINLGFMTIPFRRTIGCDEIYNRLHSLTKKGAPTATGRFMSKAMQMIHRGLTFGGGKLGVLIFIAPALVESAINVRKAENKQKVSTGISSFIEHISWVITFPLALKIMHSIGGIKYAGLKDTEVQKIRDIIDEFNSKNKAGEYTDRNVYKGELGKAKDAIKDIKNNSNWKKQNIFTKMIRGLASILTPDLERFDGRNTGNVITKQFTRLKNLPRNLFGVPLRFILWGIISMFVLESAISKGIKLIFGESYNYEKEEEMKTAKKEQKKFLKEDLNKRLYETQANKLRASQITKNIQQPKKQGNAMSTRGLDENSKITPKAEYNRFERDNYKYIPSSENTIKKENKVKSARDNYTYIPAQNSTIQSSTNGNYSNVRSYIPSQRAANIQKTFDNSGLESALRRADRAEQTALKILSGNFEHN